MNELALVNQPVFSIFTPSEGEPSKVHVQASDGVCLFCGSGISHLTKSARYCDIFCRRRAKYYRFRSEIINKSRKYRSENPNTYHLYYERNKDRIREYTKARYSSLFMGTTESPPKKPRRTQILRELVFCKYGAICASCGFTNKSALSIDHVNGDGAEHRRTARSYIAVMKDVLRDESGRFQILCMNCQWIKRAEKKETGRSVNLPYSDSPQTT